MTAIQQMLEKVKFVGIEMLQYTVTCPANNDYFPFFLDFNEFGLKTPEYEKNAHHSF